MGRIKHNPRCRIFREPPGLRDANDCNCGAIAPLPQVSDLELVKFDPEDPNTYPSVCQSPEEVAARFGYTGGETLLFDRRGNYVGQVVNQLSED